MTAADIEWTDVRPHTAEGFATHEGKRYSFMAYWARAGVCRTMLAIDGRWVPHDKRHPLRAAITPLAARKMNEARP